MKSYFHSVGRVSAAVISLAFASLMVGCVPYQTYETVKSERDRVKTAYEDLTQKYNSAIQKILRMEKDGASSETLQAKVANQEALINDLKLKLSEAAAGGIAFKQSELDKLPKDSGVELEGKGIRLGEQILFDAGLATLKNAKAREILDSIAQILKNDHPNEIIHISGHTDSDPLNRTKKIWETNWNLGSQRAHTVFKYFVDKGVPENRMVLHSLGYLKPIDSNETKEGKARNRRVVIELGGTKV